MLIEDGYSSDETSIIGLAAKHLQRAKRQHQQLPTARQTRQDEKRPSAPYDDNVPTGNYYSARLSSALTPQACGAATEISTDEARHQRVAAEILGREPVDLRPSAILLKRLQHAPAAGPGRKPSMMVPTGRVHATPAAAPASSARRTEPSPSAQLAPNAVFKASCGVAKGLQWGRQHSARRGGGRGSFSGSSDERGAGRSRRQQLAAWPPRSLAQDARDLVLQAPSWDEIGLGPPRTAEGDATADTEGLREFDAGLQVDATAGRTGSRRIKCYRMNCPRATPHSIDPPHATAAPATGGARVAVLWACTAATPLSPAAGARAADAAATAPAER